MGMNLPQSDGGDGNDELMPMAEINVTPFVDVMLVLLIIFMVAAPLMMSGVGVKLPQTAAAKLQQPPKKPLVLTVAQGEQLYIRDDPVPREGLMERLTALHESEGDVTAYIRADESIPHGTVMEILGEVSAAGYGSISLLSQTKKTMTE